MTQIESNKDSLLYIRENKNSFCSNIGGSNSTSIIS